ncbi:hypothetical protein GW933_04195 [Candidatus Falkowbacteria bacterium]|uniref:Uncharacterized protein n=1 Tax=Candidatus Buchananbacteria bacterium CG10_big_fil_rev_8_21_14_0_10_33_19 TaxID=1974525 RepID=A0A2H0W569_9BACT|nr:hypothetical protein [Candidatus Falkowbacteria bacterium]PIS06464.1 MAG: hypothetical protein COT80_00800 [Candidatus Buchananbacteria bacterium CG10_big_fil_rev_8_21_14_0_10_33_19]
MYSIDEYKNLTSKYGPFASWAIWNYKKESDSLIINQNFDKLHSKFIFLGLNISRPLTNNPWSNFHGGRHDRKLKYACNDNKLRGSYMTDIFKGIDEPQSNKFKNLLTDKIIRKNVEQFNREMKDIKINDNAQFIILGTPTSLLAQCFNNYFKQEYKNRIIYHYHYSYYKLTDKEWVNGLWEKLNINQNFDLTIKKYKLSNII